MKNYTCHKKVKAGKITQITQSEMDGTRPVPYAHSWLVFGGECVDGKFEGELVSSVWLDRHKPSIGGYFVQYDDDYQSFSPAEVFESGYALEEELATEEQAPAARKSKRAPKAEEPAQD